MPAVIIIIHCKNHTQIQARTPSTPHLRGPFCSGRARSERRRVFAAIKIKIILKTYQIRKQLGNYLKSKSSPSSSFFVVLGRGSAPQKAPLPPQKALIVPTKTTPGPPFFSRKKSSYQISMCSKALPVTRHLAKKKKTRENRRRP